MFYFVAFIMEVLLSLLTVFFSLFSLQMNTRDDIANDVLRYVALGDSYTIGEGVLEEERWPNLLVDSLADSGIEVMLVLILHVQDGRLSRSLIRRWMSLETLILILLPS